MDGAEEDEPVDCEEDEVSEDVGKKAQAGGAGGVGGIGEAAAPPSDWLRHPLALGANVGNLGYPTNTAACLYCGQSLPTSELYSCSCFANSCKTCYDLSKDQVLDARAVMGGGWDYPGTFDKPSDLVSVCCFRVNAAFSPFSFLSSSFFLQHFVKTSARKRHK